MALSLNNIACRGDLILNEHLATVCSLRGGKISAIDTYLSDVDMLNAFLSKPRALLPIKLAWLTNQARERSFSPLPCRREASLADQSKGVLAPAFWPMTFRLHFPIM